MSHTSGSWEARIYGGWDAPRVWSDSGSIAILQHHESGPSEAEANARLMAASKDLLEALKVLLPIAASAYGALSKDLDQARAAIAKATGEQT